MVSTNDIQRPLPFTTHRTKIADNLRIACYGPLSLWLKGNPLSRVLPDVGSGYIPKAYIARGYKC
jgi:hypothetical protein